jgi:hypothetical protein
MGSQPGKKLLFVNKKKPFYLPGLLWSAIALACTSPLRHPRILSNISILSLF